MQQLKEYLLSQCEAHSSLNTELLSDMLEDKQRPLALLINERVLNIPTQIGSLMLQTLLLVIHLVYRVSLLMLHLL